MRLLATATKWLGEQGMTDVRGPVHPSLNYECGLLVDGFDTPPTYLIPYNKDYYGRLLEVFWIREDAGSLQLRCSHRHARGSGSEVEVRHREGGEAIRCDLPTD